MGTFWNQEIHIRNFKLLTKGTSTCHCRNSHQQGVIHYVLIIIISSTRTVLLDLWKSRLNFQFIFYVDEFKASTKQLIKPKPHVHVHISKYFF